MPGWLTRGWRVVRTASAFAFFFGGAALLAAVLPLVRRLAGSPAGFDLRSQRWIARGYRLFMDYMRAAGLIRVTFEGAERLAGPGPLLVVANHPTLVDTPLLGARMPQADCIANPDWADHPLLRGAIAAAHYVRNDAGADAIEDGARRLRDGRRVLIFPEGTRTPAGQEMGPFRRGAAHIALRADVPITPVVITCAPRTLMKGQHWYDVPDHTFELRACVLPPIAPKDVLEGGETTSVAARKLTEAVRARILTAARAEALRR